MSASLVKNTQLRVSSVLNRDVKQFGKKYLTDGEEDTCWNSDQVEYDDVRILGTKGSPQWILMGFPGEVTLHEVHLQFQGGFAGKECWIETGIDAEHMTKLTDIYPEDINSLQTFPLPCESTTKLMRIVFNSSTDFYGRVTIYKLDVLGDAS